MIGGVIWPQDLVDPPNEYSLCPFWFWNDNLCKTEIARQIQDFEAHGVSAFVIHPRVGLPRSQGWMSTELLTMMRFAIEEAERRGMWVVLYDEGMYPSGSASGEVVAQNPEFACRGLVRIPAELPCEESQIICRDEEWQVIERPIRSVIRGLHYLDEGPEEEQPPAADLLNPEAMAAFIELVYERYREEFGRWFGSTIRGIFTDEPSLLGRPQEPDLVPGTRDIFDHVRRLTGHDLRERALRLWDKSSPERRIYDRGLRLRLEETFYQPLSRWCQMNGIDLMGHPEHPDDLSALSYFQVPGQDLVWRWVLPGPTALEGPQATQAKAAESAMVHGGRRRNSNELAGAYGHELTFEELQWLVYWCAVRGTNLFIPHAFYYSVRGPRKDERPPDVGPHSPWWTDFASFAMECRRLSWLNSDSEAVCRVAILENEDGSLPWEPAKALHQHQIEFQYLPRAAEPRLRDQYEWIIADAADLETVLVKAPRILDVETHPDLRLRHVRKGGKDYFLAHNENGEHLDLRLPRPMLQTDLKTLTTSQTDRLRLGPLALALLTCPAVGSEGTFEAG